MAVNKPTNKNRWAIVVLLIPMATLVLFIVIVTLSARTLSKPVRDPGDIALSSVALNQDQGQLYLDAQAVVELPTAIRAGLDNGVPLQFVLTLKFLIPRQYWFDRVLAKYEQRFSLTYYELTRHYRVRALQADVSRNYRSLSSALRGLGQFERLPLLTTHSEVFLVDDSLMTNEQSADLVAVLDFRLDTKSLPLPLQPLIMSSWRLASEEYLWPVD